MSGRRIADLLIKIGADSYEFQQKTKQVESGIDGLAKRLDKLGKELSLKLTAPLMALGAVALKNYDDQIQRDAKLLRALNGRADIQQRLLKQASELQNKSTLGDEAIIAQQSYFAALKMSEGQIKASTEAAVEMSYAFKDQGMNIETASKYIGQMYSGSVGRLGKLIPQLKELTAEQLKNGDGVKYILENYKGFAETAAKEGLGFLKQIKNQWGDLMEEFGKVLLPAAQQVGACVKTIITYLQALSPEAKQVIVVVGGIAAAIGPLAMGIGGVIRMLPMLAAGFTALLSPVGLIVAAVLALGAAFFYAHQRKKELLNEMTDKFSELSTSTLEKNLAENQRLQEVNERESPWQGNTPIDKLTYALNKGDRRKKLEMEETALREAIKRRADTQAESARVEAESAKIAEQMQAALKGTSTETKRSTGLISDLRNKIEDLEKSKLLPGATVEDIAAANDQIAKLKEELQGIEGITSEQLNRKPLEPILTGDLANLKLIAPELKIELPDLKPIVSKAQEQMKAIHDTVKDGMYGWAGEISDALAADMLETEQTVKNYTDALTEKGWSFTSALEFVYRKVEETCKAFDDSLSAFLSNSIVAAAEAIGQIMAGDLGFGGLMKAILLQFAGFLKQIGSQLIQFGVMIVAFKTALKSVLANPWAAIAVGAAMVAAAAIMTALINKNAKDNAPKLAKGGLAYGPTYAMVGDNPNAGVDPEVIAPLSRLKEMMTGGGTANVNISLSGELKAKGRDLVYALGKENFKIDVLGG